MIVPMVKVYLAARTADRNRLVEQLGELGVVHLAPVDPAEALPDESTRTAISQLERALRILSAFETNLAEPQVSARQAAEEVVDIQRRQAERHTQHAALQRQIEESIHPWGELKLSQLSELREAGIDVQFFSVPQDKVSEIHAECVEEIGTPHAGQSVVAVIDRSGDMHLPAEAQPLPPPSKDVPTLRAEAAALETAIQKDHERLKTLAGASGMMRQELDHLREEAGHVTALRSGLTGDDLFALQGWIPKDRVDRLSPGLRDAGLEFAVHTQPPNDDDNPPTLIQCPKWAEPVQGLFRVLGTVPGYREFDVSIPFVLALPVFAAILIGDGGYGVVLTLASVLFYSRISALVGPPLARMVIIIGAATILWGILIGSFFGMSFYNSPLTVDMGEESRRFMMSLSFILGAIHLSIAKLWRAINAFPHLSFLADIGWALWFWGMFGVVCMFVLRGPFHWGTPYPYLLIAGGALAIIFNSPGRNIPMMLLKGAANFPLAMLGSFSDVISYVRLMAVGLASGVLAMSFNQLAWQVGFLPLTVLIFLLAHSLNIALAMIALFAHGVRLNVLEFSNNLGMAWSGYDYQPYTRKRIQEIQ